MLTLELAVGNSAEGKAAGKVARLIGLPIVTICNCGANNVGAVAIGLTGAELAVIPSIIELVDGTYDGNATGLAAVVVIVGNPVGIVGVTGDGGNDGVLVTGKFTGDGTDATGNVGTGADIIGNVVAVAAPTVGNVGAEGKVVENIGLIVLELTGVVKCVGKL